MSEYNLKNDELIYIKLQEAEKEIESNVTKYTKEEVFDSMKNIINTIKYDNDSNTLKSNEK